MPFDGQHSHRAGSDDNYCCVQVTSVTCLYVKTVLIVYYKRHRQRLRSII